MLEAIENCDKENKGQLVPVAAGVNSKSKRKFMKPKPRTCEHCNKTFSRPGGLRVHLLLHTGEKPFKCDLCDLTFHQVANLNSHIMHKHTDDRPFQCVECDRSFKSPTLLRSHARIHSSYKPYKCDFCSARFRQSDGLARHRLIHDEDRPRKFKCDHCDKAFHRKTSLISHLKTHSDEKTYHCKDCDKKYKSHAGLREHALNYHSNVEKKYKCTYSNCDYAFHYKKQLLRHAFSHTDDRPFHCTECNETFRHKSNLKYHMNKHQDIRPYKCDECDKSFYASSTLSTHKKIHMDYEPVSCKVCKKQFKFFASMELHMRIHNGRKPVKCPKCQKRLRDHSELRTHMKIHGEAKIPCKICGKMFKLLKQFHAHRKKYHSEKNPAVCKICKAQFSHASKLERHMPVHEKTDSDSKCYQCDICSAKFYKAPYSLTKHIIRVHGIKLPHECEICGEGFRKINFLRVHLKNHGNVIPKKQCKQCKKNFKSNRELLLHQNKAHDISIPFLCDFCDHNDWVKKNVDRHMDIHKRKKSDGYTFQCEICNAAYAVRPSLTKHMKTQH